MYKDSSPALYFTVTKDMTWKQAYQLFNTDHLPWHSLPKYKTHITSLVQFSSISLMRYLHFDFISDVCKEYSTQNCYLILQDITL